MLSFWIMAAALAVGAALAIVLRAAASAGRAAGSGEDATLALYRRQLTELDELAARDLIGEEERRAAEAEAGRRLLSAADRVERPWGAGGRASRLTVAGAGAGAAMLAILLYLVVGRPGTPDQPYRARLAGWRAADPSTLAPGQLAAVLKALTAERPRDPRGWEFLGKAQMAAGDPTEAARAFAAAARLAPGSATLRVEHGEALTAEAEGKITPEAAATFREALAIDPDNLPARYYLGRAQLAAGDAAGGLAAWRAIAAALPPDDPRRSALLAEIAQTGARGGSAVASVGPQGAPDSAAGRAVAAAAPAEQTAFIRGMVARLAARLRSSPDDPAGWARLVRAYGVLGDKPAQSQAIAAARRALARRPDALAEVQAAAAGGPHG